MRNVRIFFSKSGRAVYISHLDLYRLFQRAVKRCKLPVWETQGFNPHVYITFALPLALGTEGACECLDTKLTDDDISFEEVCERLNAALPNGIRVITAAEPVYKHTDIEKSEYEISYVCDQKKFDEFLALEKIPAEKKTKRGVAELDLKPFMEITERGEGFIRMKLLSGAETNIGANLVFDAFEKLYGEEMGELHIKRTAVYCKNGEMFK